MPIEDGEEKISGAEVMSWLKSKPESDGKIDLEATVARGLPYRRGKSNLTVGELRKVIANSTHEKVYSKKDALRVVNKFSGSSGLTVKAREEIADTIWQFLNEAPDIEYRADMAQDIAEFIVAKILVDSKTENPDALAAAETLVFAIKIAGKGTVLDFVKRLDFSAFFEKIHFSVQALKTADGCGIEGIFAKKSVEKGTSKKYTIPLFEG